MNNTKKLYNCWPIYSLDKAISKKVNNFAECCSKLTLKTTKLAQFLLKFYLKAINMRKQCSNSSACLRNNQTSILSLRSSLTSLGEIIN